MTAIDRRGLLAWLAALGIASVVIVLVNFDSQDPDSASYALIGARMSALPVRAWIAPEWWGLGGREGLFREHPIGAFVLPAALGKLGVPAVPAAYIVGVALSAAALLLLKRIAAMAVGEHDSAIVPWVALILPVSFINRIRATQEYPVLVLLLVAVYATQKARTSGAWIAVMILAACAMTAVKGIFVVFVPIICGLWLLCVGEHRRGDIKAWLGLALSIAAVPLFALAYERLYHDVTGDTFLGYYVPYRLGQIGSGEQAAPFSIAGKLQNVGWYTARLLWFAFPGTLALLIAAFSVNRIGRPSRRAIEGLCFAFGVAAAYIGVMSMGSTRAERFILPAYYSLGIAGTIVAAHHWPRIGRLNERLAAMRPEYLALAWLVLLLAAIPFELHVPYVKFR